MKEVEFDPWSGVKTTYDFYSDCMVVRKEYDAAPYVDYAAEQRAVSSGEQWGNMRRVASIPPAELAKLMATGQIRDPKAIRKWLLENPKLVTFEKYLK